MSFEEEFDQQLGPFYETHGEEIIPSGFAESGDQMINTMGDYLIRSNSEALPRTLRIGHYDLTKYIQEDWDRMSPELGSPAGDFPRRGFLMSSRGPAHAAGRAAEEIVLEKLLWRLKSADGQSGEVLSFDEALESKFILKPKGIRCDDYVVKFENEKFLLVESKASFKGITDRYVEKASRQLVATCSANVCIDQVMLVLTDLLRKQIRVAILERSDFLADPLTKLRMTFANQEL